MTEEHDPQIDMMEGLTFYISATMIGLTILTDIYFLYKIKYSRDQKEKMKFFRIIFKNTHWVWLFTAFVCQEFNAIIPQVVCIVMWVLCVVIRITYENAFEKKEDEEEERLLSE